MNILLVYGGKSNEHDVSLITACLAKGYFEGNLYCAYFTRQNECFWVGDNLTPQDHTRTKLKKRIVFPTGKGSIWVMRGRHVTQKIKIDVAVNCCHGGCGEDGALAGMLALCGIPAVSSGVASSGIAMDKVLTKRLLDGLGFDVVDGVALTKSQFDACQTDELKKLGFPLIVKPSKLGSSIGIALAKNKRELASALQTAFCYDNTVLCEKALGSFTEYNCAVMTVDGKVTASRVESPVASGELLSFADKYLDGAYIPKTAKMPTVPHLNNDLEAKIKEISQKIYVLLGFSGVVRFDFLRDDDSQVLYINEINTIPGSLAYNLFGSDFSQVEFGSVLVSQALADFDKLQKLTYVYDSDVLARGNAKK